MTRRALVDTTVLYAAGNRTTSRHDVALSIVKGADRGNLPPLRVPDPIAIETMNGLTRDVGSETAVDFLSRLRSGDRFEVEREPETVWVTGIQLFERYDHLSLADAMVVASARHHEIEFCYSFDDDFDGIDGLRRLSTADNPFRSS